MPSNSKMHAALYESVVYMGSGLINKLSIVDSSITLYVVVGFYIFSMNKEVQFCFQKLTMLFYYLLPAMS